MESQQLHGWLIGVAKQIHGGERLRVTTAEKERTVAAKRAEYQDRKYRCTGWRLYLEGYGTVYELEVPDDRSHPPKLLFPSSDALGETVRSVDVVDDEGPQLVAEQTADDLGIDPQ